MHATRLPRAVKHGAAVALLAAALGLAQTAPAQAGKPSGGTPTTYSGSAYALQASATLLGQPALSVGPISPVTLPSSGGMVDDSFLALSTPAPLAVNAAVLNAAVVGTGNESHAYASTATVGVNVADQVIVNADVLSASAFKNCSSASGNADIANLSITVAGQRVAIPVSAPPNTVIDAGVAQIYLNEQGTNSSGNFFVNALRIHLGGPLSALLTADVTISHAEAGVHCGTAPPACPVKDFVTGGGQILGPNGAKDSFGFVGGLKPNGLQGHFNLVDHGSGQHFQGSSVLAYSGSGNTRTIQYDTGTLTVTDNGEPGTNDTFDWTSGGYHASGYPILHGNIQLHQPAACQGGKKH